MEELPVVDGLDWNYAWLHLSDMDLLQSTIKAFYEQISAAGEKLDGCYRELNAGEGFDAYRIQVHAMKSLAAMVGILPLAGTAKLLEDAAKNEAAETIHSLHGVFLKEWNGYREKLIGVFGIKPPEEKPEAKDSSIICAPLEMIRIAMAEMDVDEADEKMKMVCAYRYQEDVQKNVELLKAAVENLDAEQTESCVQTIIGAPFRAGGEGIMKKILLIGKLNDIVKNVNVYLSEYFHVQLCSEKENIVEGMLKVVNPDLVLISLVGAYDIDSSIFYLLSTAYADTPVITIGTQEECSFFTKYYEETQFENLVRPLENAEIYKAVCRRLSLDEKTGRAKRERKKHILVVDDNGTTLRTVKAMLEEEFEVSLAISGAQAMTSMGKKRPDLILLDYEMPVCDGRMTLEMIRADEELCDIPVIFLTGMNSREHINAVLELRPAGYYLKPPVKEVLLTKIRETLGIAQPEQ